MIGKPQWFGRRKYGGWGVWPKTWQGWVYLLVATGIFAALGGVKFADERYQTAALAVFGVVFALDIVNIMIRMPRDEREKLHEAIAERNALWAIVVVLVVGLGWRAAISAARQGEVYLDPAIIAAIAAGLVVKALSNLYLERKN